MRASSALFGSIGAAWRRERLLRRVIKSHLTYLSPSRLRLLHRLCRGAEQRGLEGEIVEAGCALGGSAIVMSDAKSPDREFRIFDVFGMIPAPSERDPSEVHDRYRVIREGGSAGLGGNTYYGYEQDLLGKVRSNLKRFGVTEAGNNLQLIQGLLQDTMVIDRPVAVAHIDVDWHDPVTCCLERIFPNLVVGGTMVIDDYQDWGGCRTAVDEFLSLHRGDVALSSEAGSLQITRRGA